MKTLHHKLDEGLPVGRYFSKVLDPVPHGRLVLKSQAVACVQLEQILSSETKTDRRVLAVHEHLEIFQST